MFYPNGKVAIRVQKSENRECNEEIIFVSYLI